jgi:hypothetical protein
MCILYCSILYCFTGGQDSSPRADGKVEDMLVASTSQNWIGYKDDL